MDDKRVEYDKLMNDLSDALKDISESVLHELQARYLMCFVIKGLEFDPGNSEIRYYMCPEENPNVMFISKVKADRTIHDDYIYRIHMFSVAERIRKSLESEGIVSYIKAQALFNCFDESNQEIDIHFFMNKYKIHNLIIFLSIKGAGTDINRAVRLATECVKYLNTEILFDAYSFDDASYSACEDYMRQTSNIISRRMLMHNPQAHLSLNYCPDGTNNGRNPDENA